MEEARKRRAEKRLCLIITSVIVVIGIVILILILVLSSSADSTPKDNIQVPDSIELDFVKDDGLEKKLVNRSLAFEAIQNNVGKLLDPTAPQDELYLSFLDYVNDAAKRATESVEEKKKLDEANSRKEDEAAAKRAEEAQNSGGDGADVASDVTGDVQTEPKPDETTTDATKPEEATTDETKVDETKADEDVAPPVANEGQTTGNLKGGEPVKAN